MGYTRWASVPRPLRQTTAFQALWTLRGFLGRYGNPISRKEALWRGKRGDATNRRWFTEEQVDLMYSRAPTDQHRLVLVLTAWAGLRRREVAALRVGDVSLTLDDPRMIVTRKGGRRQELPISKAVLNVLRPHVIGRGPEQPVYPASYYCIMRDMEALGRTVGVRCSAHDLRRSFGRMLYARNVDINTIRTLYGHATTEMTLYYIGETLDGMRRALDTFSTSSRVRQVPVEMGV